MSQPLMKAIETTIDLPPAEAELARTNSTAVE